MNLETLALVAVVLAAIPAVMFLWNLPQLKAPGGRVEGALPPVSVLIPARNESANLRGALSAVLANRGAEFEVVVLDDHSEDDTAAIVRQFMAVDDRVRLETAPPLPAGWCGKQHACHVLARHARHPLLLFVDADVRLAPDAIARLSAFMGRDSVLECGGPPPLLDAQQSARGQAQSKTCRRSNRPDPSPALASGVPRQYTDTFLEKLLLPLIHFVLLGFLPIWRMRRCAKPAYGAGCGQLFVARADAYRAVGGHAAIRDSLHDGLKLPRAFRRAGYRTDLFDATDVASCRMYHSGPEVVAGLLKNAHEGLAAPAQIGPWTLLLFGGHILPWLLLAAAPWVSGRAMMLAGLAVALSLLPRLLAAWRFKQSWLGAFLHPFGVVVFLGIQWVAFMRSFQGRPTTWKGRNYPAMDGQLASDTPRIGCGRASSSGKCGGWLVLRNVLIAAMLCCGASQSSLAATNVASSSVTNLCPAFTLRDQFAVTHSFAFPRPKPAVLAVADKKGADQIEGWTHPLAERFGERIDIPGLADVSAVPRPLRGVVQSRFKKAIAHPVMLDWDGKVAGAFKYQKGQANVYLIAPDGQVLHHQAGPASAEKLAALSARIESLLSDASATQPERFN